MKISDNLYISYLYVSTIKYARDCQIKIRERSVFFY